MALTVAEQTELDGLLTERQAASGSPQVSPSPIGAGQSASPQASQQANVSGLTVAEQTELNTLLAEQQVNVKKTAQDTALLNTFFTGVPQGGFPGGGIPQFQRFGGGFNIPQEVRRAEQAGAKVRNKEAARQQLLRRGFDDQQLKAAIDIQKRIGAVPLGRTIGAIAAGVGAGLITGGPDPTDIATVPATVRAVRGAGGLLRAGAIAGGGGGIGQATQVALEEKRLLGMREFFDAAKNEFLFEIGGRSVILGGKGLLRFGQLAKQTVPEAASLVDDFAKVGGSFSPAQLDSRFSVSIGEGLSRGSFGAGELFQKFGKKQGKAVLAFADNIVDDLAEGIARKSPTELGEILSKDLTRPNGRVFTLLDDLFNPLYQRIDDLTGKATVSTSKLKNFAKAQLKRDAAINKQFLSPAGRTRLNGILGLDDTISFGDMRTLRSSLLSETRKLARDIDPSQAVIKRLSTITQDSITDPATAKGLSAEARNLLQNTNKLYAASREGLQNTLTERLAKRLAKNPSNILKEIFPKKNPTAVRLMKESLIRPIAGQKDKAGEALWNQLRLAWAADAVGQATKEGVFNVKLFEKAFRDIGPESLKEMFSPQELSRLRKVADLGETVGKKPIGVPSLFVRGGQIGGGVALWTGFQEGDSLKIGIGGTLLFGPLLFAKFAIDPRGSKILTAGLKLRPGASGFVPNAVRAVKLARQLASKEQRALRKQKRERAIISRVRQPAPDVLTGFGAGGSI